MTPSNSLRDDSTYRAQRVVTFDVKIGDKIWNESAGDWMPVHDVRDNGYGDISFRPEDWASYASVVTGAGDFVLILMEGE